MHRTGTNLGLQALTPFMAGEPYPASPCPADQEHFVPHRFFSNASLYNEHVALAHTMARWPHPPETDGSGARNLDDRAPQTMAVVGG